MSSVSRPYAKTQWWVEPLTQSRQGFLTGSGCDGPASLGSLTQPCHLTTPWPIAWLIKGTQSLVLNKRAKRSLVPLVLYVGMKPPKQSPLRPTKTGRWVHLSQRRKGSIASFAFGYCTGLFWACLTNWVLLVLSWSYLLFCDHKFSFVRSSVITKGNHRACHRPRRPVEFTCVYWSFEHGAPRIIARHFAIGPYPPILTT